MISERFISLSHGLRAASAAMDLAVAVKNSSADAKEIIVLAVEAGSVRSTR